MKFIAGVVVALVAITLIAVLVIITGVYNIAATVPHTGFERLILSNAMVYSVRSHSGPDVAKTWNEAELREGFQEYNEMCIYCHGAPGKEASDIGKGLHPEPPDLAKALQRWNDAELFWIVKNGIKMTGMPAFGPTHDDETIWNIVGFVRRLPNLSVGDYKRMEGGQPAGEPQDHHHH
jgi:mono/diheme cytochrome c family protein